MDIYHFSFTRWARTNRKVLSPMGRDWTKRTAFLVLHSAIWRICHQLRNVQRTPRMQDHWQPWLLRRFSWRLHSATRSCSREVRFRFLLPRRIAARLSGLRLCWDVTQDSQVIPRNSPVWICRHVSCRNNWRDPLHWYVRFCRYLRFYADRAHCSSRQCNRSCQRPRT